MSVTTRARRPGEREGVDRFFVDEAEFRRRIEAGGLLEWAVYNEHLYGTPRSAVVERIGRGEDVVLEIEVQGAEQIKRSHPEAILIWVAPPSEEALAARLAARGDTDGEEAADRLAIARREMEIAVGLFDHVVVNDDLDEAVTEVLGILRGSEETSSP